MNILQVNVRLSEGGAAMVAQTLSEELEKLGHSTYFLYGYSKHGKKAHNHIEEKHLRYNSRISAFLNLIFFRLLGKETEILSRMSEIKLKRLLKKIDIVHLHVIHSYFLNYSNLISKITAMGIPIVWTMHDQWILTGRCALPGDCTLWKNGCKVCPDLKAYPPTMLDRAGKNFSLKRNFLHTNFFNSEHKIVSCASWLEEKLYAAGIHEVVTITNSLDSEFYSHLKLFSRNPRFENLFVCRDLRDKQKIDWSLLRRVANIPNQSLTILGDNAPIKIPNAYFRASTKSRKELVSIYKSHKRLIFTSKVDHYPLTITEALACGVEVYTLDSPAAREFENHPSCYIFDSSEDLYQELVRLNDMEPKLPSSNLLDINQFSPIRMAIEYQEIYLSLVKGKKVTNIPNQSGNK